MPPRRLPTWSLVLLGVCIILSAAFLLWSVVPWRDSGGSPRARLWGLDQFPLGPNAVEEEAADMLLSEAADILRRGKTGPEWPKMLRDAGPRARHLAAGMVEQRLAAARSGAPPSAASVAPSAAAIAPGQAAAYPQLRWHSVGALRRENHVRPLEAAANPEHRLRYFYRVQERDAAGNAAAVSLDDLEGRQYEYDGSTFWMHHGTSVVWEGHTWDVHLHRNLRPRE